ncbi:Tryptophan synthase alpha chain [bioreactor metagenome]|uniref:tryptophan synthase n=1 Tax=bioreactor metagenome TaxID=1076179 RepID=A0A645E4E2_9ZZZZ
MRAGAGLIEIGVPFSDPVAEGPVIQGANLRALASGATTEGIFRLVESVRAETEVPIVLLTYLNPVFRYGYEAFLDRCRAVGVDGLILPDLPFEEKHELSDLAAARGVDLVSLIAPTSRERIRTIAREATGFLYLVSSMGVTGVRGEITTDLAAMISAVREASDVPVAVGFGISTPEQAREISKLADGVIVGSALVKLVERHGDHAGPYLYEYAKELAGALE